MAIDNTKFIHKADKAALSALKAIPGFTPILKAFMKFWNEREFRIYNLSSNLKISDKQIPKYYNMLTKICNKLQIEVPELYIELDPNANAYTYGDTKPFIVLTSGLLETVPDELIETVLAHECGHILCHHVLYHTMGDLIFSGAEGALAHFIGFALGAVRIPYYYWLRCSEFSCDRVAVFCDGTADKTIELNMRFAGYDKDIVGEASKELFMEQALEYNEFVKSDKFNKAMEAYCLLYATHPFSSVRAYEANEWAKSEEYKTLINDKDLNSEIK